MRRGSLFRTALLAWVGIGLATGAAAAGENPASYVGSETCQSCHEAQWQAFQTNPHHRAELDHELLPTQAGCEGCHGPGSLHAEAAGDRSQAGFYTIRVFTKMSAQEVSDVCRSCHRTGEQFYWDQGRHASQNVSCVDCHSVHHSQSPPGTALLRETEATAVCLRCHTDKHAEIAHTAHMPLREGGMTCADCHNPHGSAGPRGLRAATVNDLCYQCHADKRGPFLWEHAPVRENCTTCHLPHGSNNAKVLATREPFLCQRCHNATRHPGTLYDQADLNSNRLFNRSCTNCHSQIHGSNHPSGKTFLR